MFRFLIQLETDACNTELMCLLEYEKFKQTDTNNALIISFESSKMQVTYFHFHKIHLKENPNVHRKLA